MPAQATLSTAHAENSPGERFPDMSLDKELGAKLPEERFPDMSLDKELGAKLPGEKFPDMSLDQEKGAIEQDAVEPRRTWAQYLHTEVSNRNTDYLMLACCVISGLSDSTIYNAYGTFVSMQTGNTVFVGLGGSNTRTQTKPYGWAKSLTSIFCFTLGALFFSRLSRLLGPLQRLTLASSFILQAIFIAIAAAIIESGLVEGHVALISRDIEWGTEAPIALLSFQAAGQMVGSRMLGLSEIPTVVLTSVLCDFASDPELVSGLGRNVKRNRRAGAFFGILIGAIAGGFVTNGSGQVQVALWMAFGIKVVVGLAWCFWPEKEKKKVLGGV